jgi:hypothetical protein
MRFCEFIEMRSPTLVQEAIAYNQVSCFLNFLANENLDRQAQWQAGLTKSLPKDLQTKLPTIEQLEAELDAVSVEIVDSE